METTLIILKPDAVQRGLMGRIISRFEDKGLQIVGAKMTQITLDLAAQHYREHLGKPFYESLVGYMSSSPVLLLAVQGPNAVQVSRKMMGATSCLQAELGTIRGDFGISTACNLVHGSDSPESASRELDLFFEDGEILSYDRTVQPWITGLPQPASSQCV